MCPLLKWKLASDLKNHKPCICNARNKNTVMLTNYSQRDTSHNQSLKHIRLLLWKCYHWWWWRLRSVGWKVFRPTGARACLSAKLHSVGVKHNNYDHSKVHARTQLWILLYCSRTARYFTLLWIQSREEFTMDLISPVLIRTIFSKPFSQLRTPWRVGTRA